MCSGVPNAAVVSALTNCHTRKPRCKSTKALQKHNAWGNCGTKMAVQPKKLVCRPRLIAWLKNTKMIATHASFTSAAGPGARRPGSHPRRSSWCFAAADSGQQEEQQRNEDTAPASRRQLGLRLLSAAAALAVLPAGPPPADAAGPAALTPYQRGLALVSGVSVFLLFNPVA